MNRDRRQPDRARNRRHIGRSGSGLRRLFGALAGTLGTIGTIGAVVFAFGRDLLTSLVGDALTEAGFAAVGVAVGVVTVVWLILAIRRPAPAAVESDTGHPPESDPSRHHPSESDPPRHHPSGTDRPEHQQPQHRPSGTDRPEHQQPQHRPSGTDRPERQPPEVAGQPRGVEATGVALPSNLPYLDDVVGRAEEVARIVKKIREHHAVAVIGRRAVGTSYCVIKAANQCRDEFPAGQFYLDLRGRRPWTPYEVVRELARIAGFPPPRSSHPEDVADAARDLGRSVNGRSLLLVLDNVDDPAQVQPLLPPTTHTCRLVLAGGPALDGLPGVMVHRVREPSLDDAERMYRAFATRASGARPRHVPPDPVVREIVDLCARYPRAIAALARHGWPPEEMLAALRTAADAPAHKPTGESTLANELVGKDLAYQALSTGAQRAYRLLSLAPAALDREAVRALTGTRGGRGLAALDELVATDFVEQTPDERYRIRPLLTRYARLHLRAEQPLRQRAAASRRLTKHLAELAEQQLALRSEPPVDGPARWFATHENLLTAIIEQDPAPGRRAYRAWFRLAAALCAWYAREERLATWHRITRRLLAAEVVRADRRTAGWTHNQLGVVLRRQGRAEAAVHEFSQAIEQLGRRRSAQPQLNLGLTLLDQGRAEEAIAHLTAAEQHRTRGDHSGRARTDLALGVAYLALGDPEAARNRLVEAANACQLSGDDRGYGAALTNLMLVLTELGEYIEANDCWEVLRNHKASRTSAADRAAALLNAAASLLASDPNRAGQAHRLLTEGQDLLAGQAVRHQRTHGRILLNLGDAALLLNRPAEARERWREAAEVSQAAIDQECLTAATERLTANPPPPDG